MCFSWNLIKEFQRGQEKVSSFWISRLYESWANLRSLPQKSESNGWISLPKFPWSQETFSFQEVILWFQTFMASLWWGAFQTLFCLWWLMLSNIIGYELSSSLKSNSTIKVDSHWEKNEWTFFKKFKTSNLNIKEKHHWILIP